MNMKVRGAAKTSLSFIRAVIRRYIWLKSRERAAALKRDKYTCVRCKAKQSKAKGREVSVMVHHIFGINWGRILNTIREEILQSPDRLETLCGRCHTEEHETDEFESLMDWMG